ncbi:hypothetical protein KFK09_024004 [Dendrobium nobile]|uniref:Uncharacterized protein n=1 Tax=Dendrobium nobile TaxID=94219 RepID=A0A8T3ACN7_DENNO|nr:hypothetical protein KFK09_024004 [Dendrobium nobile]
MDGTFHQERPLDLLRGSDKLFSFDLKSATDWWPFFFMFEMMVVLFDRRKGQEIEYGARPGACFRAPFPPSEFPSSSNSMCLAPVIFLPFRGRRIDYQENSGEEASFNAPQDNRAIMVGRFKSIQRKATFHSLVSSWHTPPTSTPRRRGDQKTPFVFPPSAALAAFLNKPSSLLCAAFLIEAAGLTPKAEFYGREGFHKNLAMRYLIKYCKRRGLLIELGREAILVIRINNHSCTEYGRIPRYGHSGSPSEDNSHTILARAGEASTGKAPYPYNCLLPTLRHPFQV